MNVMEKYENEIIKSKRDAKIFFKALLKSKKPNKFLIRAAKRYKVWLEEK